MKKEELLNVFPSLLEEEIQGLPHELVVCWYPSSGSHFDAASHWKGDKTINPNCFIFSDASRFEFPEEARIICSKKVNNNYHELLTDFFEMPVDLTLFPADHLVNQDIEVFKTQVTTLYSIFMLTEDELIIKKNSDLFCTETMEKRFQLQILHDSNLIDINSLEKSILDECITKETTDIMCGEITSPQLIQIITYKECVFILVQGTNEYIYKRFIEEGVKIPLLTLNRPMDPFIFDHGIDIEKLGVQEFIAGHSYVSSLVFGDDFKKHPDFIFQTIVGEVSQHNDLANLYSRVK
jgi:hypothetical protein